MFLSVLHVLHPPKAASTPLSSAAGWTRYILMFYSFEQVFHWHSYHDKGRLTVLKGVSKDFCQGTPLLEEGVWLSQWYCSVMCSCMIPHSPSWEKMAAFYIKHLKCQGVGFWELTLVPKEEYEQVCEVPYRRTSAVFQGPFQRNWTCLNHIRYKNLSLNINMKCLFSSQKLQPGLGLHLEVWCRRDKIEIITAEKKGITYTFPKYTMYGVTEMRKAMTCKWQITWSPF